MDFNFTKALAGLFMAASTNTAQPPKVPIAPEVKASIEAARSPDQDSLCVAYGKATFFPGKKERSPSGAITPDVTSRSFEIYDVSAKGDISVTPRGSGLEAAMNKISPQDTYKAENKLADKTAPFTVCSPKGMSGP